MHPPRIAFVFLWALLVSPTAALAAAPFDDFPVAEEVQHPAWFRETFLNLREDLQDALKRGKKGLVVYFGQRHCAYCRRLMQVNFGMMDIVRYTQTNFDVVGIDIWGAREVTDMQGRTLTERDFALQEQTNFTPSLVFYDAKGNEVFKLRGYYPPYEFRAALEYVADAHYEEETFKDYLARGEHALVFEPGELSEEDFFLPPPYALDRSKVPSQRPLLVIFERGNCHACDVLHGQFLQEKMIRQRIQTIDTVQLDVVSDDKVITPSGEHTTVSKWAQELGIFYTPLLLFFDERGNEVLRVDSVVHFYRLHNILSYVSSGAYREQTYQQWRMARQLEQMQF